MLGSFLGSGDQILQNPFFRHLPARVKKSPFYKGLLARKNHVNALIKYTHLHLSVKPKVHDPEIEKAMIRGVKELKLAWDSVFIPTPCNFLASVPLVSRNSPVEIDALEIIDKKVCVLTDRPNVDPGDAFGLRFRVWFSSFAGITSRQRTATCPLPRIHGPVPLMVHAAVVCSVLERCRINHSAAACATCSSAPCSSKRWVAPAMIFISFTAVSRL